MTVGETFLFLHNVIQLGWDWIIAGSNFMWFFHGCRTAAAKGLKDKHSIQTHPSAKTSWVWTTASCEEWGNIDSPGASLWGQLAHPTVSLQSKHSHILGLGYILKKKENKIRSDNFFFFFFCRVSVFTFVSFKVFFICVLLRRWVVHKFFLFFFWRRFTVFLNKQA